MKGNAAKIIGRINGGERIGITSAQISEVVNLLETHSLERASLVEEFLIISS
jgi:hypothetical protein